MPMTKAEREAFLKEPRIAILALTEQQRGPLAVPVWYDYEPGGSLWFLTQRKSHKGRLIAVSSRISLCTQDEEPPYRYVNVEGPVTAIEPYKIEPDTLAMATRYLGEEGGRKYTEAMRAKGAEAGGIKVVMQPERWLTVNYGA